VPSYSSLLCVLLFVSVALSDDPKPPTSFPPTWFSWMVVSVTLPGNPPNISRGQMVAFDSINKYSCRYDQQNLLNLTALRPDDYCDAVKGEHYRVDDTSGYSGPNPPCTSTSPLGTFETPSYPSDFLSTAVFMGVVKVNQKFCNHFYSSSVEVSGTEFQMDVFTQTDNGWPCQISIQNKDTTEATTWAFDGFKILIPDSAKICTVAQLLCGERNWTCQASPKATPAALKAALIWVCGVEDCSPINPGGQHFLPNTLVDHCNWAFNQYYLGQRLSQGVGACNFGGSAILAPPPQPPPKVHSWFGKFDDPTVYPLDLVC